MDYSIKKRLNQDITVYPFISRDGAGDATYAEEPTVLRGFMYGYTRVVRNLEGVEVISKKTLYLTQMITVNDLIMVGDKKYPIIDFQIWPEENGDGGLVEVLL